MKKLRTPSSSVSWLWPVAGLTALTTLLASPSRAGTTLIGSPITSGGYTFTNFDFSPLTGMSTGSNANGISNSGQVTGTTVDMFGMSTFTNFSGNTATSDNARAADVLA